MAQGPRAFFKKRRKYWEAWLICKLKPINQRSELYRHLIEKGNGREWKRSIKKIIYQNDIDIRKNTLSRLLKLKKLMELTNSR
jgi:hypothetical protein